MLESLFNKVAGPTPTTLLKRDSDTGAFCEICEILKNICELLLLFSIQHSYLLIFKKPCALTPFCWTPTGVFRNLLIISNGAFRENSQWLKFLTAFAKMFHHRSLTASKNTSDNLYCTPGLYYRIYIIT